MARLAGPQTDAYQTETATGLVLASEVELQGESISRASTAVASHPHDLEKGHTKDDSVKLVTFLEDDPGTSTLTRSRQVARICDACADRRSLVLDTTGNPRNFTLAKKWRATLLATLLCFNSGFASSIITGGLNQTRAEFNVSEDLINLTVCLFVVGFGFGPLGFAPASERESSVTAGFLLRSPLSTLG